MAPSVQGVVHFICHQIEIERNIAARYDRQQAFSKKKKKVSDAEREWTVYLVHGKPSVVKGSKLTRALLSL